MVMAAIDPAAKLLDPRTRWFEVPDPEDDEHPYRFLCLGRVSIGLASDLDEMRRATAEAQDRGDVRASLELARRFAALVLEDWNVFEPGEDGAPVKVTPTPDNYVSALPPDVAVGLLNSWFAWFSERSTVSGPLVPLSSATGSSDRAAGGSPTRTPAALRRNRRNS